MWIENPCEIFNGIQSKQLINLDKISNIYFNKTQINDSQHAIHTAIYFDGATCTYLEFKDIEKGIETYNKIKELIESKSQDYQITKF